MNEIHQNTIRSLRAMLKLEPTPGKFAYEIRKPILKRKFIVKGYNHLRHAGSVWAMVTIMPESAAEGNLAMRWLSKYYQPIPALIDKESKDSLFVTTKGRCKSGGNALAVLAHLALVDVGFKPDENLAYARKLINGLLGLQMVTGDFVHKINVDGTVDSFRSDYYTGEILFALCEALNSKQYSLPRSDIEDAVLECFWYLTKPNFGPNKDQPYGVAEESHWMLYALASLYRFTKIDTVRAAALEHAEAIAEQISRNFGQCLAKNRSTPLACRAEGLAAYMTMSPPNKGEMIDTLSECLTAQMSFYHEPGMFIGGVDDEGVRIDYLQHSAMSFYQAGKFVV